MEVGNLCGGMCGVQVVSIAYHAKWPGTDPVSFLAQIQSNLHLGSLYPEEIDIKPSQNISYMYAYVCHPRS